MSKEDDRKHLGIGLGVLVVVLSGILILTNLEPIESPTGQVVKEVPQESNARMLECPGTDDPVENLNIMARKGIDLTSGEIIKQWRACGN
tara:strand:- start:659 stop:928 length:270 start_codon:yes stop_codon:yes gene_type:complete